MCLESYLCIRQIVLVYLAVVARYQQLFAPTYVYSKSPDPRPWEEYTRYHFAEGAGALSQVGQSLTPHIPLQETSASEAGGSCSCTARSLGSSFALGFGVSSGLRRCGLGPRADFTVAAIVRGVTGGDLVDEERAEVLVVRGVSVPARDEREYVRPL